MEPLLDFAVSFAGDFTVHCLIAFLELEYQGLGPGRVVVPLQDQLVHLYTFELLVVVFEVVSRA